ncbi:MAG: response regulator [Chloroflexota bacterium]
MGPTRVLLVDDHCIVRQGIRSLLELERDMDVVGEAPNGAKALELIDQLNPDLVLLDVKMPDMDGAEVCRQSLARHPDLPIIILTAFPGQDNVLRCIRAGAKGFVLKDVDVFELVRTIRAVCRGESVLDSKIAGTVMDELRKRSQEPQDETQLTDREVKTIQLMAQGLTNQEIGWQLCLSTSSVKMYIRRIQEKLGVSSRGAIIYEASKRNLI